MRLVAALADDRPAQELRDLLGLAGVEVIDLGLDGPTPEKVRVRGGGRTLLRLDRGGRERGGVRASAAQLGAAGSAISEAAAVLVSDYGRGSLRSRSCGRRWPACPRPCRWCGTRIPGGRSRWRDRCS